MSHVLDRRRPISSAVALATLALLAGGQVPARAGDQTGAHYFSRSEDGFAYALVHGDRDEGMTFSGSGDNAVWKRLDALARSERRDLFWFRVGDREGYTTDPAVIERAREILRPVEELGAEQGALGERQAALGAQQAKIGGRQARIGAQQARLGRRLGWIAEEIADRERRGASAGDLRREQRAIEREMEALSEQIDELGRGQSPLGESQAELGRRQEELARRQQLEQKRADRAIRSLVDETLGTSKAKRLR